MDPDDALDFDLLIAPQSGGYRVRLLSSPAGTGSGVFSLPFSDLEIENLVLRMGQMRTGVRRHESPQTEAAREFGRRLFDAVFGDELAACWQNSAAEAGRLGKRLRLRLRLGDAPELLDLPWEYLYDSSANRFVALSSNTPVVRYLDLPGRVEPMPISGPLRILALIASPQDVAALDVEREWNNLQTALADLAAKGQVQLDRCTQPTLPELQRTLRRQEVHIFHFVGHGGYDSREGDGVLLFEDEGRRSRPISGRQLGALLHDEGLLRLAVLNACEGARTSRTDPFAGVGQSLLQQGVPAVIAMQFAITDGAASTFAHEFYAALADGFPVDRSLAEARKAMFAQSDSVEWGTPVLYLRAMEGRIFNLIAPPPSPPASAPAPLGAQADWKQSSSPSAPPAAQPSAPLPAAPLPAAQPSLSASLGPQTSSSAPSAVPPSAPPPAVQTSPPASLGAQLSSSAPRAGRSWITGAIIAAAVLLLAAAAFLLRNMLAPAAPTGATGEAASATAAAGQPAFRYTFENGAAGGWTGDPSEWTVIPDETGSNFIYQGAAPPERETASELPNKDVMATWRNYAIHLRLRAHQTGSDPDIAEFWLTTRAPLAEAGPGCNFYNTSLDFRTQLIVLSKGGSDGSCDYIPIEDNGFPLLGTGQWHDVAVTVQGDRLQVTVDGDLVIDAEDGDVHQGYAYLNVGPGAIVQFDDISVYKLDE